MADDDNLTGNVRRVGRKDRKKELPKPPSLFPIEGEGDVEEETQTQNLPVDMPELPTEPLALDLGDELSDLVKLAQDVFAEDTQQTPANISPKSDPHARFKPPSANSPTVPPSTQPSSTIATEERYPPVAFSPSNSTPPMAKPKQQPTSLTTAPASAPKRERRYGKWYHDLIAVGFMIATITIIVVFITIWRDPWTPLNPLAPPTPFIVVSWTPDMTALAVYHAEQTRSAEQSVQQTPTPNAPPITAQDVAQPISPPTGDKPFTISESGVLYTPNANGRGCNWSSIAGTVTTRNGDPLDGYAIQIVDIEDPTRLNVVVTSGSSLNFGAGGFELSLGGTPRIRSYRIQLYDPANVAVSEAYQLFTREGCNENVAIVNFVQVR